jgi:hypothetical protein
VNAGCKRARRCAPASVSDTLRVVLESKRTPIASSNSRMAWLIAEGETPRRFAARVKLRSSATIRNAERAPRSILSICEFYSQWLIHLWDFSKALVAVTLVLGDAKFDRRKDNGGRCNDGRMVPSPMEGVVDDEDNGNWAQNEMAAIAQTDDLHVSPFRDDGKTYGTPTWIWSVVVDDGLYVRAYNGQASRWYQAAMRQKAGRITAAGLTKEVEFEPVNGPINDLIDEAYQAKYKGSPYLPAMIGARARSATVKISPGRGKA